MIEHLISLYGIHMITFWSYSLFWFFFNYKYLVLKDKFSSAKYSLLQQLTVFPLCGITFWNFYETDENIKKYEIFDYPKFSINEFLQFGFMILWVEIVFYYIHRLFHTSFFIKIHKKHHYWISPTPWESIYSSCLENIFLNLFPTLSAPLLCKLNIWYLNLWICLSTLSAVISHSNNTRHSLHHKYFNVNYGVIGLMDYIHNTNKDLSTNRS